MRVSPAHRPRPLSAPQRALGGLARTDARALARDPFLLVILAGPVLLVAIIRLATAPVSAAFDSAGVDAAAHHPLAAGFLVAMLVPQLLGAMTGLLLLDERDAGLLLALRVSPLGLRGYLAYRLTAAGLLTGVAVGVGLPASGLVTGPLPVVLTVAVLAAALSAVPALLLPALAPNKVEGVAVLKAAGLPLLAPALAWYVTEPWRWAFGLIPTAWPAFVLWEGIAGHRAWPLVAGVGALWLSLVVTGLLRRLTRRVLVA